MWIAKPTEQGSTVSNVSFQVHSKGCSTWQPIAFPGAAASGPTAAPAAAASAASLGPEPGLHGCWHQLLLGPAAAAAVPAAPLLQTPAVICKPSDTSATGAMDTDKGASNAGRPSERAASNDLSWQATTDMHCQQMLRPDHGVTVKILLQIHSELLRHPPRKLGWEAAGKPNSASSERSRLGLPPSGVPTTWQAPRNESGINSYLFIASIQDSCTMSFVNENAPD